MKNYFFCSIVLICTIYAINDDLYARQFRGSFPKSRTAGSYSSHAVQQKKSVPQPAAPQSKSEVSEAEKSKTAATSQGLTVVETPETPSPEAVLAPLSWESSFPLAIEKAKAEKKMVLVLITQSGTEKQTDKMAQWIAEPQNRPILDRSYVLVQVDGSANVDFAGKTGPILQKPEFREMGRKAGIAIIDFQNDDYLGKVVGAFPLIRLQYSSFHINQILTLPPGTLTQRMLTFAIRVHPNRPQSANGRPSCFLMKLAFGHACNQASTHVMGHQNFSSRSSQVMRAHPGTQSSEICAQTGGGVALIGALGLAQLWRGSSAHWSAMKSPSRGWGYDMQRSNNGNWYGCGLFAK